ncbi:MAG TPA: efflux RND transporter periplasmic adaptor subunit [Candidatus Omnitrophota bacterium]|nr:efflux RND transporter periplasmic adaptor subunit [Candidatus Omnitrophota bacterium]
MEINKPEGSESDKPQFQEKPFLKDPLKQPGPSVEGPSGYPFSPNKKRLVIIGVSVALIVLLFAGKMVMDLFKGPKVPLTQTMAQQQQAVKDAPVAVKGFKAGRFNYEDTLNVLGNIKGSMELKLSFEIPGVISSINYKEGEHYEEGALLVSLKQDDILLRLKRAQAGLNKAESQAKVIENEVAENEKLLKMGAIPQSTVDKKKLELDAAKYETEAQRLEMKANESFLEKSNLYAPSSGMLGELNIEEGENISQSTLIGTHINTEYVYAEFGIVERDVQKITLGQKAKVFVDAFPDKTFEGVIENIAPQISGTSRTSTAKVRVENPEGVLIPGMFARVRIMLYSKKDALVIPTDAIQGGEGEKFIYVVKQKQLEGGAMPEALVAPAEPVAKGIRDMFTSKKDQKKQLSEKAASQKIEDGTVEKRPVTVGYTRSDYSQIDAGLTEGEIVVMTGFERLEDGKKVRLVETQEAEL